MRNHHPRHHDRHHQNDEVIQRLAELGLTDSDEIKVIRDDGWGPVLIEIRQRRYMIGRGIAYKLGLTQVNGRGRNRTPSHDGFNRGRRHHNFHSWFQRREEDN